MKIQSKKVGKDYIMKGEGLQKLMLGIKQLQAKISHIPITRQTKSYRNTPVDKKIQERSISQCARTTPLKQNRYHIQQANRKRSKTPSCQKTLMKNSKTNHLQMSPIFHSQFKNMSKQEQSDLMTNYVSLQIQNLKLENRNLQLEKQLVQQSLLMAKREKQLLKSKLKRIKTYQTTNKNKEKNKLFNAPLITQFDLSPQKQHQPSVKTVNVIKKFIEDQHPSDIDSLLLSDDHESSRSIPKQSKQSQLQEKFWDLFQHQNIKGKVREALGEIGNKLKEVRKK